jgi:mRNA interferase RelE/StbE
MSRPLVKFKLLYTQTAVKDIQKLDRVVKKKIKKKIEVYSRRPFFYAKKLIKPLLGTYRWRVGNYRIIFDIDRNKIIILRIGHRKEIYS